MKLQSNKSFTEQGNDWYVDRYESIKVERNRYFLLLLVAIGALIISLFAMLALTPLKTAVPYVIQIDKDTGITTVVQPADLKALRAEPALTNYFLLKYLNARMSYDWGLRQTNADIVRALSSAQVYRAYATFMDANNPQSPIKLYADNKVVTVHVTSHSSPYPNIAEIHFYTENMDKLLVASSTPVRQYWVATIKYAYADNSLPLSDRENINPIGFFVTEFQLNQDIPGGVVP